MLLGGDGSDFAVELHAALISGTPAVPLDPRLERRWSGAQRLVPLELPYPDVATVMYTSGTTSAPKPCLSDPRQLGRQRGRLGAWRSGST